MTNPGHPTDEQLIEALSQEARDAAARASAGQPPPGAWHRLQARREATVRRASWRWVLAGSLGLVLVGVGGWRLARERAGRPLTYQVTGGAVEDSGYVRADAGDSARLTFSDGTRIQLASGAKVSVTSPGVHGARVRVQDGRAHFEVVHRPHAAWTVDAGPYAVEVTGTVFDVRWSGADEVAEVHLRSGSVRVSGPLLTEHATLRPGQSLIARLAAHELRIEEETPAPARTPDQPAAGPDRGHTAAAAGDAGAAPTLTVPPPADTGTVAVAVAPAHKMKKRPTRVALVTPPPAPAWTPQDWSARIARGDAKGIVAEAEEHGLDTVLEEADAAALVALADAARYDGRTDLAGRVLVVERQRFARTTTAANAAFFLGRLADDHNKPTEALDWYRRYLSEQPHGPYASEALGRTMMGVAHVSGRAAAHDLAEEYLERFPNGTYLLHARQILAAP